jgi:hypothetical protein
MLKFLFALIVLFFITEVSIFSQPPNWLWSHSTGNSDAEQGTDIATDVNGNVYVTGFFQSASITIGSVMLTNSGPSGTPDIFLAKYDSSGNFIWAKSAGGNYYDKAFSVATDAIGNIYVTGYFYSPTISFGSVSLSNLTAGSSEIFLAKYNVNGNLVWAKSAGGTFNDVSYSTATDAYGNIFIAGSFESASLNFGTLSIPNSGTPYSEIFIAKYDSSGTIRWARAEGSVFQDYGLGVAADVSGNVFLTGNFQSTSVTFGSTTLVLTGGNNFFIAKYDSAGAIMWARTTGGNSYDYGNAVTTDNGGNVFVTGGFANNAIVFGTDTLTNSGQDDIFITKFDGSGNVLWARSAGGTNDENGTDIDADAAGNVYVTGQFFSSSISFGATVLTNAGNNDVIIAKLDGAGNSIWANSAGGTDIESGNGISVFANDDAYVTGVFNSSSVNFGGTSVVNSGGSDMFLARYGILFVGINEVANETAVTLYPNPATKEISIGSTGKVESMEIFGISGNKIISQNYPSIKRTLTLDVSGLLPGIYFLKLKEAESVRVLKFVKL